MESKYWTNENNIYDRSTMNMLRLFKGVSVADGFTQIEVNEIEKEAIALINIGWSTTMAVKRAIDATLSARTYWSKSTFTWKEHKN